MMPNIPDYLKDGTNVYRTRDYIVKQCMTLRTDEYGSYLFSHDTYYRCTPKRDREYETAFSYRVTVNGQRIHTHMYARKYID